MANSSTVNFKRLRVIVRPTNSTIQGSSIPDHMRTAGGTIADFFGSAFSGGLGLRDTAPKGYANNCIYMPDLGKSSFYKPLSDNFIEASKNYYNSLSEPESKMNEYSRKVLNYATFLLASFELTPGSLSSIPSAKDFQEFFPKQPLLYSPNSLTLSYLEGLAKVSDRTRRSFLEDLDTIFELESKADPAIEELGIDVSDFTPAQKLSYLQSMKYFELLFRLLATPKWRRLLLNDGSIDFQKLIESSEKAVKTFPSEPSSMLTRFESDPIAIFIYKAPDYILEALKVENQVEAVSGLSLKIQEEKCALINERLLGRGCKPKLQALQEKITNNRRRTSMDSTARLKVFLESLHLDTEKFLEGTVDEAELDYLLDFISILSAHQWAFLVLTVKEKPQAELFLKVLLESIVVGKENYRGVTKLTSLLTLIQLARLVNEVDPATPPAWVCGMVEL